MEKYLETIKVKCHEDALHAVLWQMKKVQSELLDCISICQCDVNRVNCEEDVDNIFDILKTEIEKYFKHYYEKRLNDISLEKKNNI